MALEEHIIHQSANRHHSRLGADKYLVMCSGAVCSLIFAWFGWFAVPAALVIWFASIYAFRQMFRSDPLMRRVLQRALGYRSFYPTKSDLHAPSEEMPRYWY